MPWRLEECYLPISNKEKLSIYRESDWTLPTNGDLFEGLLNLVSPCWCTFPSIQGFTWGVLSESYVKCVFVAVWVNLKISKCISDISHQHFSTGIMSNNWSSFSFMCSWDSAHAALLRQTPGWRGSELRRIVHEADSSLRAPFTTHSRSVTGNDEYIRVPGSDGALRKPPDMGESSDMKLSPVFMVFLWQTDRANASSSAELAALALAAWRRTSVGYVCRQADRQASCLAALAADVELPVNPVKTVIFPSPQQSVQSGSAPKSSCRPSKHIRWPYFGTTPFKEGLFPPLHLSWGYTAWCLLRVWIPVIVVRCIMMSALPSPFPTLWPDVS